MKTLCIIPCGKRKSWDKYPNKGPTKARHVYIGAFAKKCRECAEKFCPNSWVILSAKHGFLFPDDIVPGPYNVSFNDEKTNLIFIEKLRAQARMKGLYRYDRIIVLAGRNYAEMVRKVFPDKEVITSLSKYKGLGYMMQKLNEALKKGTPL